MIGDFRAEERGPGILRFGFAPAYLRHVDTFDAAQQLARVLESREYLRAEFERRAVVT